jgi:hypothetical protein
MGGSGSRELPLVVHGLAPAEGLQTGHVDEARACGGHDAGCGRSGGGGCGCWVRHAEVAGSSSGAGTDTVHSWECAVTERDTTDARAAASSTGVRISTAAEHVGLPPRRRRRQPTDAEPG